MPKPLTVWSQQIVENSSRDGNTRPPYLPPEICMQVKKQQLEPDMEKQTGSSIGKEYIKAVYCYLVYLTYMQSTSCEGFSCGLAGKNPPAMQETWVQFLGWEDPLEKGKATLSNILTWRIPWTI